MRIPGVLTQIESGPGGAVWGTNRLNQVWFRVGVSSRRPTGRYWRRIRGRMSRVSVGCTGVYALNKYGQIFRFTGEENFVVIFLQEYCRRTDKICTYVCIFVFHSFKSSYYFS